MFTFAHEVGIQQHLASNIQACGLDVLRAKFFWNESTISQLVRWNLTGGNLRIRARKRYVDNVLLISVLGR